MFITPVGTLSIRYKSILPERGIQSQPQLPVTDYLFEEEQIFITPGIFFQKTGALLSCTHIHCTSMSRTGNVTNCMGIFFT
jgi:hypothetical protein